MQPSRPSFVTALLVGMTLLLAACGGGGGGGGGDGDGPSGLSFSVRLASTSAFPLTPLTIETDGLSEGASVEVIFENQPGGPGFNVRTGALRVGPNGSVLTGVPLYVNSQTGALATGQVNVRLLERQPGGSQRLSSSAALTIQVLPPSGSTLGQTTRAFLTASALAVQRRISQLEFLEGSLAGAVDTGAERSLNADLLQAILETRNDVDRIIGDPSAVIGAGTAVGGSSLQFTSNSLSILDRILAVWVSGLPLGATAPKVAARSAPRTAGLASVNAILQEMSTWVGLASDIQTLQDNESTTGDNSLAFLDGVSNSASLLGTNTDALGMFLGWAGVWNATYRYLDDWGKLASDVAACAGVGPCQTAADDAQDLLEKGAGQFLSAYAQAGIGNLNFIYQGAPTGPAALGVALYNYVRNDRAAQANEAIAANISSALGGGVFVNGAVRAPSGLDMIQLSAEACLDQPSLPASSLSDANGNYVLSIPSCDTDPDLTVVAIDPITATPYDSVYIGITTNGQSVSAPLLSYSGPPIGTTPTPGPEPEPTPTPEPEPEPTPTATCCACAFDVYCNAFGPGGCWRCQEFAVVGGTCQQPYAWLWNGDGACVCDPGLYQICQ